MPKLITSSLGSPIEVNLKPGLNRIGRKPENDCVLDHDSVSTAHCEITVDAGVIYVCDLGSTNGTFIDGEAIRDGFLNPGQTLRVGAFELSLVTDIPVTRQSSSATSGLKVARIQESAPPPVAAMPRIQSAHNYRIGETQTEKTFLQQIATAFAYPFRKEGIFVLIVGTIVFVALDFASFVLGFFGVLFLTFWLFVAVFGLGYLAAFMKRIITSSARGEEDLPDLPDLSDWWEDIVHPAFVLLGTFAVSFGPAISVFFWLDAEPLVKTQVALVLGLFGCLYLPMALIAVAMFDSIMALNPILIVPSIVKIGGPYVVTCLVLAGLLIARTGINFVLHIGGIPVIPTIIAGFVSIYFVAVEMRILGLLYKAKQYELNWRF